MTYGSGIIALCLAAHGSPVKMRHAHGYAHCRLPVTLKLVPAKVKFPSRHAVKLGENARGAHLTAHTLRLLCSGQLALIGKHIYARDAEAAILAHAVADSPCLRFQQKFIHHMTCHEYIVFAAPSAYIVGVSLGKTLCRMVKEEISDLRKSAAREIPYYLGKAVQQAHTVCRPECILKIVCKGI